MPAPALIVALPFVTACLAVLLYEIFFCKLPCFAVRSHIPLFFGIGYFTSQIFTAEDHKPCNILFVIVVRLLFIQAYHIGDNDTLIRIGGHEFFEIDFCNACETLEAGRSPVRSYFHVITPISLTRCHRHSSYSEYRICLTK